MGDMTTTEALKRVLRDDTLPTQAVMQESKADRIMSSPEAKSRALLGICASAKAPTSEVSETSRKAALVRLCGRYMTKTGDWPPIRQEWAEIESGVDEWDYEQLRNAVLHMMNRLAEHLK